MAPTTPAPPPWPRRLLLVGHGYPPRENAGTEQHMAALARALHARGVEVTVFAATRDPLARQYALREERDPEGPRVVRLVQNLPTRPLAQAERDRAVEAALDRVLADAAPELVHVHHLQFLSSGLRFPVPFVLSLHDEWLWCAAGGLGLLPDGALCPGPQPRRCAPCAAAWHPRPRRLASLSLRLAGRLARILPAEELHGAFRRLPEGLRQGLQAPRRGAPAEPPAAAQHRNEALAAFARAAALRLSPSRHLALRARGLGPIEVLEHGVPTPGHRPHPRERQGPLLFLGTIAAHKGPDLVVRAWRRAFPAGEPPLRLHGPVQDPRLALGHPLGGPLDRAGVARALAEARALVLGSRWPENAPLVVLEARAAGCPVIAPALGGLPELVAPGVDGWLYPPGDEEALAAALREAVARPLGAPPRPPPSPEAQLARLRGLYGRAMRGPGPS